MVHEEINRAALARRLQEIQEFVQAENTGNQYDLGFVDGLGAALYVVTGGQK